MCSVKLSEPVKTDGYLKEKSSRLARHPLNWTITDFYKFYQEGFLNI